MEKPPPGHRHLLGIKDPAESIGVWDDIGKSKQVHQVSRYKTGQKCGPLGGRGALKQISGNAVKGHERTSFSIKPYV